MKYEWPALQVNLNESSYEVYEWCSEFVWNAGEDDDRATVIEDEGVFTLAVI